MIGGAKKTNYYHKKGHKTMKKKIKKKKKGKKTKKLSLKSLPEAISSFLTPKRKSTLKRKGKRGSKKRKSKGKKKKTMTVTRMTKGRMKTRAGGIIEESGCPICGMEDCHCSDSM